MRALVTGSSGTVGTALRGELQRGGHEVVRWDRARTSTRDYAAMEAFVAEAAPDVLFHLAVGDWSVTYEWTSELAWICRQRGIAFVFTSTVMVFTPARAGPYSIGHTPDAAQGYGGHKRAAEERVRHQNPEARIARLGWQIGESSQGNQMLAWLTERGGGELSTRWLPACSFLDDAAVALVRIAQMRPGLYQVDANEGWSLHDIGCALKQRHGADWTIVPTGSPVHDQRMHDPRIAMPPLADRLPELLSAAP